MGSRTLLLCHGERGQHLSAWLLVLIVTLASPAHATLSLEGETSASVVAQFSPVRDDSDPIFEGGFESDAFLSALDTNFGGSGYAFARYAQLLRVSCVSTTSSFNAGDPMISTARMFSVYRPYTNTLAPGVDIEVEIQLSFDGTLGNGGDTASAANATLRLALLRDDQSEIPSLANYGIGFASGNWQTPNTSLDPSEYSVNSGTASFDASRTVRVTVQNGAYFGVEYTLSCGSSVQSYVQLTDTASFSVVPVTAGVQVEIQPAPEPSAGLAAASALLALGSLAHYLRRRDKAGDG